MAAARPLIVFVLGGPGAGKGTQCAKIVNVSLSVVFVKAYNLFVLEMNGRERECYFS